MERANSYAGGMFQISKKFGPDVYRGMAEQLFPNGSVLRCLKCNVKRHAATSEIAEFLKFGFPVCRKCNHRTTLDNPYQSK